MHICTILIIVLFVVLVVMFCTRTNNEESFYFPPSMIRAGDQYQAPGAIVDQGFETDIADYEYGEGQSGY